MAKGGRFLKKDEPRGKKNGGAKPNEEKIIEENPLEKEFIAEDFFKRKSLEERYFEDTTFVMDNYGEKLTEENTPEEKNNSAVPSEEQTVEGEPSEVGAVENESGEKKHRRNGLPLLILAVVLFLLAAAVAVKIIVDVRGSQPMPTEPTEATEEMFVPETEAQTEPETEPETEPDPFPTDGRIINVMVVGQSSRDGEEAKLSDTMILASVNTATRVVTLTSLLRDTYIALPPSFVDSRGVTHSGGHTRINAAYALGYTYGGTQDAMRYLNETVKYNFGVEVDHSVEIDFDAFEKMIDLMDGIKLDLDEDEVKYMDKYFAGVGSDRTFQVGSNLMNGWEALVYARMRHANYGDNDFNRTNRQRIVLGKLLDKCRRRNVLQLTMIAKEILPYITTDMSVTETLSFAMEIIPMLSKLDMVSNQCPASGTFWGEMIELGGVEAGVLKFDANKNRQLLMAIAEADHN